jgi:hypothetical protein
MCCPPEHTILNKSWPCEDKTRDKDDIKQHWVKNVCNKFKKPTDSAGAAKDFIIQCQKVQKIIHKKCESSLMGANSEHDDDCTDDSEYNYDEQEENSDNEENKNEDEDHNSLEDLLRLHCHHSKMKLRKMLQVKKVTYQMQTKEVMSNV